MPSSPGNEPFVGREREIAEITAALDRAFEGIGSVVAVLGEPGIGKTRLVEEVGTFARDRNATVVLGRCHEDPDVPAYWPWAEVIRNYLQVVDDSVSREALGPYASALARVVPQMRNFIEFGAPTASAPGDTELEGSRFALFDAFSSALADAAQRAPLMIVLEDVHWADEGSLRLLEFAAGALSDAAVLILITFRDVQLERSHPLSRTLGGLTRERSFSRVSLSRMDEQATATLVELLGIPDPSKELLRTIYKNTDGNPFFVTEVVRLIQSSGQYSPDNLDIPALNVVPEGVREAIGRRLTALSAIANELLEVGAIVGQEFEYQLLSRLLDSYSETELIDAMDEAERARLIQSVTDGADRKMFSHALIRDTLRSEIPATRRLQMHARIVETLESIYGNDVDDHADELAGHLSEAGTFVDRDRLVYYSVLAGEKAYAAAGFEEAARHFETAYAASEGRPADTQLAIILAGVGRAWCFAPTDSHSIQDAWNHISRAFYIFLEFGDTQAAVALAQTPVQFAGVQGAASVLSRALELARPGSADEGRLLTRYSIALHDELGDTVAARTALETAEKIADALGDKVLMARTLVHLVQHAWTVTDFRLAAHVGARAAEAARIADDAYSLLRLGPWLGRIMLALGDRKTAEALIDESVTVARQRREPIEIGLNILTRAEVLFTKGDFTQAATLASEADRLYPWESPMSLIEVIEAERGNRPDDPDELTSRLREASGRPDSVGIFAAASAAIIGHNFQDGEFLKLARSLIEIGDPVESALPRTSAPRELILAFLASLEDDRQTASELYPRIKERAGTADPRALLPVDRILALLALTLDRPDDAALHFEDALTFCRKAVFLPQLGWVCADYAYMLLDRAEVGDSSTDTSTGSAHRSGQRREKALELCDEGLGIARDLGMTPLEQRLTAFKERAGSSPLAPAQLPDGLTQRELEVLRLVAAGRTNEQIAGELVIVPGTAAGHVHSILAKTGCANRTEAAAYASDRGLLDR